MEVGNGQPIERLEGAIEPKYEVETIQAVRLNSTGQRELFVKWKGYSYCNRSWEPEAKLMKNAAGAVAKFKSHCSENLSEVILSQRVTRGVLQYLVQMQNVYDGGIKSTEWMPSGSVHPDTVASYYSGLIDKVASELARGECCDASSQTEAEIQCTIQFVSDSFHVPHVKIAPVVPNKDLGNDEVDLRVSKPSLMPTSPRKVDGAGLPFIKRKMKILKKADLLKAKVATSNGAKYVCKVCGKRFVHQPSLSRHNKIHK